MKSRSVQLLAGTLMLAMLPACAYDPIQAAPQVPIDLAIDFCSDGMPVWFGFQNEGQDWRRVIPDADGTFRFTANNFVSIAYVLQNGADYATEIFGAQNTEFEEVSDIACLETAGAKQVSGTFTGTTASQGAAVSMGFRTAVPVAGLTSYILSGLAERPLDLVASRDNFTSTSQASDRIVIRRSQNFVNNATVPALDFDGAEAVAPAGVTTTISGLASGETGTIYGNFTTQLRTFHPLFFSQVAGNSGVLLPAVPSALTAAGDYHDVFLNVNSASGETFRGVERYFRTSSNFGLELAAALTAPVEIEKVASNPYLRLEANMDPEDYITAASFTFRQQFGQVSVTRVTVTVTGEFYTGTGVAPWRVVIPDLSLSDGWLNAWGLQDGTPVDWQVTSYLGRATLVLGAPPTEGETVRFAGRLSLQPIQPSVQTATAPRPLSSVRGR